MSENFNNLCPQIALAQNKQEESGLVMRAKSRQEKGWVCTGQEQPAGHKGGVGKGRKKEKKIRNKERQVG